MESNTEKVKSKVLEIKGKMASLMNWGESEAWEWMTTQRSTWDFRSPVELIICGEYEKIDNFIAGAQKTINHIKQVKENK